MFCKDHNEEQFQGEKQKDDVPIVQKQLCELDSSNAFNYRRRAVAKFTWLTLQKQNKII